MAKVLFRMDAGVHIGLGHLQRSLALATALKALSVDSVFLGNDDGPSREYAARHGFQMDSLKGVNSWTPEDAQATVESARRGGCGAVVVDYHEAGSRYLAQLRDAGLYVVARDDLASYTFPCQMVVNGNADAPQLPYRSSTGDTVFLLGPGYMVMRDEFLDPPERVLHPRVRNVLVILGGADGYGLMPRILDLLDRLPGDFAVTAVVGPFFEDLDGIQAAAERATRTVTLVHSPSSVSELMLEADLAISAGGQTLYELACTGCPTVAVQTASNQEGQMRAMAGAGIILEAGDANRGDVESVLRVSLVTLLSDGNERARMAAMGQRLVDGRGALRVASEIASGMGRHGSLTEDVSNASVPPRS